MRVNRRKGADETPKPVSPFRRGPRKAHVPTWIQTRGQGDATVATVILFHFFSLVVFFFRSLQSALRMRAHCVQVTINDVNRAPTMGGNNETIIIKK